MKWLMITFHPHFEFSSPPGKSLSSLPLSLPLSLPAYLELFGIVCVHVVLKLAIIISQPPYLHAAIIGLIVNTF